MAKVFVSYSRKDIEFAKRLTADLAKSNLDFWIDWAGIPPTVDWWKEIEKSIEEADVFLFLISPDSAKSKICGQEIDTAVNNGKRIIPIVVREIEWQDTPSQLGHLNYIFFSRDDDFDTAVKKLMAAIQTDYEWVAYHRRLQVKALEWERKNKESSFLLRGKDLQEAELQLTTNSSKEPHPTDLQREYLFECRKATDRQRRITTSISIAGIITLAALAVYGFYQAGQATNNATTAQTNLFSAQTAQVDADNNAATADANARESEKQAQLARGGELAALALSQRDVNPDVALLLSIEALKNANTYPAQYTMLSFLKINSLRISSFSEDKPDLINLAFNNTTLVTGYADGTITLWDVSNLAKPILVKRIVSNTRLASNNLALNQNGKILASGGENGVITLWDISDPKTPKKISELITESAILNIVIGEREDHTYLASLHENHIINIWNIDDPKSPTRYNLDLRGDATAPIGTTLAISNTAGNVSLWSPFPPFPERVVNLKLDENYHLVSDLGYLQALGILMSSSQNGDFAFWDTNSLVPYQIISTKFDNGFPTTTITTGRHLITRQINDKLLTSGTILASGNLAGDISLWDFTDVGPVRLGLLSTEQNSPITNLVIQNNILASTHQNGQITLWDIDPNSWLDTACQLTGRNFTMSEWKQYFPYERYRKTCEQWSLESIPTPTQSP